MPNRILRESITSSETLNELAAEEEVFFYRLLVVADDYGLMDARPAILKARCFPLRESLTTRQVEKWLVILTKAGLIVLYEHGGKPFLQIRQWDQHQRIRNARAKYPQPSDEQSKPLGGNPRSIDSESPQPAASRSELRPPRAPAESESESNPNPNPISPAAPEVVQPKSLRTEARQILDFLNEKAGRAFEPVDVNLDLIVARLKEGATAGKCRQVIAKKTREWQGDEKMALYLRPETLFNRTKFAQYVGELVPHERL